MVAAYGRRLALQQVARCVAAGAWAMAPWRGARAAGRTLLTLGDSLTAGYGLAPQDGFEAQLAAALHAAGHDVSIIDGGVSGDTSAGGRARIGWLLGGARPDAAIVELGGNDGLRGLPVAAMAENLAAILDALGQARVPTLLSGMYPPPNLGAGYTAAFRAAFDTLGRRPGLLYDPFFLQGVALHPALIQADGIHPNAQGVQVIVARLLPVVVRLLERGPG